MGHSAASRCLMPLLCMIACSALRADGHRKGLEFSVNPKDGSYTLSAEGLANPVLRASAAVNVNGKWLRAADYPQHVVTQGQTGRSKEWSVRYAGLKDAPELLVQLRANLDEPFGEVQVTASNVTGHKIEIEALRVLDASGAGLLNLGGPTEADRVLSDSFSEDRPAMQIRDLPNAENHIHRAVGVQLIYNQQSKKSWFIGALTSDKFLSVMRLRMADAAESAGMSSYEVDSIGTTELLAENSLQDSPAQDRVELSLPLAPGGTLASERMLISVSDDYHKQLETYAHMVRDLHHARITAPTPLGWWSWTAYYFGLNEGTALTNAEWLAEHLKPFGYHFFHIDEGYQYARGEYATPDASLFPHGMAALERKVMGRGLTPGIWTAPFEVSERSYVFTHHPEWLVHNAKGEPIHLGSVTDGIDHLYALDPTNPGAQAYLRNTYSTLVNTWSIRYIKMDFMEDSAVEGSYFRPHTTALEAQRIGIQTIRDAVGEDVLLDKDGCELLNPVGLVDMGRISQDTGHTFSSSKDAATGIAARYYMNRNYFLADPDAFSVSAQTVDDQNWHGGEKPLTLDEAKVSIALSAVSGGLYEIGDDLPTLGESKERTALVENRDLINMAHLGRSSTPLDLMSYSKEDAQPSIFLLKENDRQRVLTIFNWTDETRTHRIALAELGLKEHHDYNVTSVLEAGSSAETATDEINITQPAHSVRVLKIVDPSVSLHPPATKVNVPTSATAGESVAFTAEPSSMEDAIVQYTWDFGDGVSVEGRTATHAYTHDGSFVVKLAAAGVDGGTGESSTTIAVTGAVSTKYHPGTKRRLE
jgi:alpha-galactosidase